MAIFLYFGGLCTKLLGMGMKTLQWIGLALLMGLPATQAATFSLQFAVDLQATNDIRAVHVLWGTAPRNYTSGILFSNTTTLAVTNILNGFQPRTTYFFACTAIDIWGQESVMSTEVTYTTGTPLPPPAPGFRVLSQNLQASASPLGPFTNLVSNTALVPIDRTIFLRDFIVWDFVP